MFTQETINKMDKAQVAAALKLAGLLDAETVAKLNARKDALNAPAERTPFPKQAELTDAFDNIAAWSEVAKALIKEARDGNHTWTDKDGMVKGIRAAGGTGGTRKATTTKRQAFTVTANGTKYNNWREVAEALCPRPDLPKDKTNWRKIVYREAGITGTVNFAASEWESYDYYWKNFKHDNWEFVLDNKIAE